MPRPSCRPQIVEAAVSEFHRLGYHGCSVDTITKAAGVPKGSFYNHFSGKDELAAEVVGLYQSRSAFREYEPAGDESPLTELRGRFRAVAERHRDRDFARGCLLANLGAELGGSVPRVRDAVDEAWRGWTARVADLVTRAVAAGELPGGVRPEAYARFLLDAFEGAVTRAKVERSMTPLDDFFDHAFGLVSAGGTRA
ncbi:TetR/AcrR family transcriptional regulator [Nakamurella leprariae]|uniref:TetR family transcriptional regulator C-terminal domain-containing protein n=1 Tax=Nakamurella leprariae TaxID=2803911 RepID=A0A938YD68_9ACTN|nr:TetR/AcrR family transcriptional regulator [Nakamurella leprariae]MBM9468512.1 TetR family transcriptional regulator C-terminal domain-containing protein [Nakamurella leprariae]